MKKIISILSFFLLILLLCSWGGTGHYYISYRSSYFMPTSLLNVVDWADSLGTHASDADDRKSWDPNESPRHYIDIENYPGFLSSGRIVQTVDSAYLVYGSNFLQNNGLLPYSTLITFDSMKSAFARNDLHRVLYFAEDLGHYVADGHMPLHLTNNYDGQLSGQSGIHSRIESTLVNGHISSITYGGDTIHFINDVNGFVFQYIYNNHLYVDSLLYADSVAYAAASSHYNSTYYNNLWASSGGMINTLFRNASKSLAELIYTAWVMTGGIVTSQNEYNHAVTNCKLFPNPAHRGSQLFIQFAKLVEDFSVKVYSIDGSLQLNESFINSGKNQKEIKIPDLNLKEGTYLFEIISGNEVSYQKIIITD
jgi:hypothetical protein